MLIQQGLQGHCPKAFSFPPQVFSQTSFRPAVWPKCPGWSVNVQQINQIGGSQSIKSFKSKQQQFG